MEDIKDIIKNTEIPLPPKKSAKTGNKVGKGRPPVHSQFKPGQSGNPNGRPPGTVSVTEAIKRKLLEVFPEKDGTPNKEKRLYLDKLVERILENGIQNGESRTQKDIWAYMDGHPKATIDIGADKDSLGQLTEFFRSIAGKK